MMKGDRSVNTVRWNDEDGRYQIVTVAVIRAPGTDGGPELGEYIFDPVYTFPAGTDNATACAAYDQWRETGELPGGVTTA